MTTALETAFPLSANQVQATVRSKLAEAMIGVFSTPNLSAEDFTIQPYRALAIYGGDGDLEFYAYDASDTTTADDGGVSCIVVSGRRYIKRAETFIRDSALSATTSAQPGSPTLGDTYIVPAAPSGTDWASEAKTVAQYTARGWIFRQPFVGMVVYVEDSASFYHYSAAGTWTLGLPGAIADASITPPKLFHPFAILKVVDQSNAPPGGTPTNGTMYQVGTSPTGAFSGQANKIARWNSAGAGAWEFISPAEGDTIYRLDASVLYTYRSGAWVVTYTSASIFKFYTKSLTSSATNSSTTPTNIETQNIQAPTGSKIRVSFRSAIPNSFDLPSNMEIGVRIDTSSTLASLMASGGGGADNIANAWTIVAVPDASAHDYSLAVRRASGAGSFSLSSVPLVVTWEVFTPN